MSFKKSAFYTLGAVSGVMAMLGAQATEESQSFESFSQGDKIDVAATQVTGWYGYGVVTNTESRTLAAGTPISGNHAKHVFVDGWVSNSFSTVTGNSRLDMLVQAARPEDALSEMTDTDAKFALAIDPDGALRYWSGSAWNNLSTNGTTYTEGQWIRVSLVLDTSNNKCKVSVDGQACVTDNGKVAADSNVSPGAWYPLITSASKIASMKVIGTTAIDDVLLTSDTAPSYKDASGADVVVAGEEANVPLAWYDVNNLPTNQVNATDGSGMTLAAKYLTGLSPNDGVAFKMETMTMLVDGDNVKARITIPACNPPTGYEVKIQTSANGTSWSEGATAAANATTVDVQLPSGANNVTYFRMVAGQVQQ